MESVTEEAPLATDLVGNVLEVVLPPSCPRVSSLLDLPSLMLYNSECLLATTSRALGLSVIMFAGLIKVPQIITILSKESVAGISLTNYLIETFGYAYNLAAHYRQDYPLSTYGDFFLLLGQNFLVLLLICAYTNRRSQGFALIATFIAGIALMCSTVFPLDVLNLMIMGNVLIVVTGRGAQIHSNYKNRSTGNLSLITCLGIWLGAVARIFTTLQDIGSPSILSGYIASALFNGAIVFQVLYYRYVRPKVKPEDKAKKAL